MEDDLKLREIHFDEKGLDMRLSGEPAMMFMKMFVDLFEQNGGKNFLTITLKNQDNKYAITIQNCNCVDTPAEKLSNMKELLSNTVEELKGYREEHGDYSHQIKGDYLYDAIKLLES
jgi:hypothetical protein